MIHGLEVYALIRPINLMFLFGLLKIAAVALSKELVLGVVQ
jgi:hypothetical protein